LGAKSRKNLRDNGTTIEEEPDSSSGSSSKHNHTGKDDHGVIRTSKTKLSQEKSGQKETNYFDWEDLKTEVHARKDAILYCCLIGILTAVLLVFIKGLKSKFYTNKFDEKGHFSARKLFKGQGRSSAGSKGPKDVLKTISEEANES
jgi:hypothetical protein